MIILLSLVFGIGCYIFGALYPNLWLSVWEIISKITPTSTQTVSNRSYGYVPGLADQRDYMFSPVVSASSIPASVDLRDKCPPVMDQGQLGSCTAHGSTGAARYDLISTGKPDFPMSRLQVYYDTRALEGTVRSDSGGQIKDAIKVLGKNGASHETLWPYVISRFAKKPNAKVYADAKQYEALSYSSVAVDPIALKQALASGKPVVVGFTVYESFESATVAQTGIVPMPAKNEKVLGGHCVYLVGYGQKPGYFTARNSWGTGWGDKGDFYIPEGYIGSSTYGGDYWVINLFGK